MYITNYTRLASIRPLVLSSSAYHRTSITLVSSPDHFRYFFNKGKVPLFTAESLPDGTAKLDTALGIDELFLTPEERNAMHEEPVIDQFKVPSCDDIADLADFANQHSSPTRHQVPAIVPRQQNHGQRAPRTHQRISNKYKQRRKEPQRGSIGAPAASYTSAQFDQDVASLWG